MDRAPLLFQETQAEDEFTCQDCNQIKPTKYNAKGEAYKSCWQCVSKVVMLCSQCDTNQRHSIRQVSHMKYVSNASTKNSSSSGVPKDTKNAKLVRNSCHYHSTSIVNTVRPIPTAKPAMQRRLRPNVRCMGVRMLMNITHKIYTSM